MKAILTMAAAVTGLLCQVRADSADPHLYSQFVGKKVTMQGMGWIQRVSNSATFLVTPTATIWLEPWTPEAVKDFEKWNGKLIEVSGILSEGILEGSKEPEGKGPVALVQRYTYFHLKDFAVRAIDRVDSEITGKNAQQGVASQSATRPESESKGGDKPQSESEARSR